MSGALAIGVLVATVALSACDDGGSSGSGGTSTSVPGRAHDSLTVGSRPHRLEVSMCRVGGTGGNLVAAKTRDGRYEVTVGGRTDDLSIGLSEPKSSEAWSVHGATAKVDTTSFEFTGTLTPVTEGKDVEVELRVSC